MGIKYLQSFITRLVPDGIFPVNILDEIIEWKSYNPDCCVVIDVMGFTQILTKLTLDSNVYGGNYRLARDHLNSFLKTLCDHGATLVFFYDGPTPLTKSSTVVDRFCQRFSQILSIPDKKDITIDVKNDQQPISKVEYAKLARDICSLYGKLHTSCGNDSDLELAKYATENNAMAILSHDSDFLIFEGVWRYWSIQGNELFSHFQTNEFNRKALRRHLGLSQEQMPLLATLAGNDIINVDLIRPIFMESRNARDKFYSIALFIRRKIMRLPKNLIDDDIKLIARTMFKDPDDDLEELVKHSIKSYDIGGTSVKYFEESIMQQNYYGHIFIHTLLECTTYLLSNNHYDFRENKSILLKDTFLPVYQRLSGVVLKHKNDLTLEMFIRYFNENGDFVQGDSPPIYPTIDLPELDVLIKPTESDYTNFSTIERFELLSWIITEDNQLSTLNVIDKNYNIVIAVLYYLVKQTYITVTEADCILSMVYAINENKINHQQIETVQSNARAITVIAMYEKLFEWIKNSYITLGLTKYLTDIEVDGIYFQYLTNIFNNKPEVIKKCISRIERIRSFYPLCG